MKKNETNTFADVFGTGPNGSSRKDNALKDQEPVSDSRSNGKTSKSELNTNGPKPESPTDKLRSTNQTRNSLNGTLDLSRIKPMYRHDKTGQDNSSMTNQSKSLPKPGPKSATGSLNENFESGKDFSTGTTDLSLEAHLGTTDGKGRNGKQSGSTNSDCTTKNNGPTKATSKNSLTNVSSDTENSGSEAGKAKALDHLTLKRWQPLLTEEQALYSEADWVGWLDEIWKKGHREMTELEVAQFNYAMQFIRIQREQRYKTKMKKKGQLPENSKIKDAIENLVDEAVDDVTLGIIEAPDDTLDPTEQKWHIAEEMARKESGGKLTDDDKAFLAQMDDEMDAMFNWSCHELKTSNVVQRPVDLLDIYWPPPRVLDMADNTRIRRNKMVARIRDYWTRAVNKAQEKNQSVDLLSNSYRTVLAAMELENQLENYATFWRKNEFSDTELEGAAENAVRLAAVQYFNSHRPVKTDKTGPLNTQDPDYLTYRRLCRDWDLPVGTLLHEANL